MNGWTRYTLHEPDECEHRSDRDNETSQENIGDRVECPGHAIVSSDNVLLIGVALLPFCS